MPDLRTTPSQRAKSKRFYDTNRKNIAIERIRKRVVKTGSIPQAHTLQEFDLTREQIDNWLREGGHPPHQWQLYPWRHKPTTVNPGKVFVQAPYGMRIVNGSGTPQSSQEVEVGESNLMNEPTTTAEEEFNDAPAPPMMDESQDQSEATTTTGAEVRLLGARVRVTQPGGVFIEGVVYENPKPSTKKEKQLGKKTHPYVIKYDEQYDESDEEVDLPDEDIEVIATNNLGRRPLRPDAFTLYEAYDAISRFTDWSSTPGSTQDTYKARLYQIMVLEGCDTFDDMVHCFKNIDSLSKKLIDKFAYNSKDYFNVIFTLRKASDKYRTLMGPELLKQYDDLKKEYIELAKQEAFTKTELESPIPYNLLTKSYDILRKKDPISMKTLITKLYLDQALRDNYGEVRMLYKPGEKPPGPRGNYYNLADNVFYLREYKVSRRYGPQEFQFTNDAVAIIKAQIAKAKQNRTWLIEKPTGGMYPDGKLSTFVREAFQSSGVKFPENLPPGINNIRKATVSNLLGNKQGVPIAERLELANRMLHSIWLQKDHYNRRGGSTASSKAKNKRKR